MPRKHDRQKPGNVLRTGGPSVVLGFLGLKQAEGFAIGYQDRLGLPEKPQGFQMNPTWTRNRHEQGHRPFATGAVKLYPRLALDRKDLLLLPGDQRKSVSRGDGLERSSGNPPGATHEPDSEEDYQWQLVQGP